MVFPAVNMACSFVIFCILILFGYGYGVLWWEFGISENIRLNDETSASFSNCDSGVKCAAICQTERFCGFAQFSSHGHVCDLVSTQVCGSTEPASQWTLYKRIPVDITGFLVQNGAKLIPAEGVAQRNANLSIDGITTTRSYTPRGPGSWWAMEFGGVWPIAKVSVIYYRPYNILLHVNMSGTLFARGPCTWITGMYGVGLCTYIPHTGCWYNVTSINITCASEGFGLTIYEITIYS